MDVSDALVHRQQADRTVAILRKDPIDHDVGNIPGGTLMGIQCHQIIIASTLEIADHTIKAIAVEVDPVHIAGSGISVVEIKHNVFNRKI
jgi:cobalamin synthase